MLDRLIHSFVALDDPTVLGYGYERAYADLTHMHLSGRQQIHTLFIGGGGYSFPRYIEATYAGAAVDVIEIDRGDAFSDLSIPYHLPTVEFNRIVQERTKPDGIYLVNVIDKFEDDECLKAYGRASSIGRRRSRKTG